jgi:hypothetical protein
LDTLYAPFLRRIDESANSLAPSHSGNPLGEEQFSWGEQHSRMSGAAWESLLSSIQREIDFQGLAALMYFRCHNIFVLSLPANSILRSDLSTPPTPLASIFVVG